jgi:hypothetical protein
MYKIILTVFVALLFFTDMAYGHGGRTDNSGGHTNRKTGEYHCHKEPCFSNQQKTQQAYDQAVQENRQVSSLYNRKDWPHWVDYDRDCQDARAEALISASTTQVKFKRNKGCVVSHGNWLDPYSGNTFTQASKLDIDHIIPLKEAHISGGSTWSREARRTFANDPENLIVVSASENRQKGAKDPAQWLPDIITYHCEYVKRWLYLKTKYHLKMDTQEKSAIDSINQRLGCKS